MNNKSKPEINPVTITALSHDGRGITTINNKTTFVARALPEESVSCRIIKKHSKYCEAEVVDIHQPSPERTEPPCPHFGICGGCSMQHLSVEKQIAFKQQVLLDQLQHFGKVTPETVLPPQQANTLGYRRKARLGVKHVHKKGKVLVGFREKAGRYLADLTQCVTLHPAIGQRLTELSELIASLTAHEHIPQIEVAIGDEDVALIFRHLIDLSTDDQIKLQAFGQHHQFHIYTQPNSPLPLNKLWPLNDHHRLSYTLPQHHLEFLFHPLDFTQINLDMNRQMVALAIQQLDLTADDRVLDLFCGIGNFTLPIARQARQVIGIEGSMDMVRRGQENAQHNGITNVEFYAANLDQPNSDAPWLKQSYDKILLDPPRIGAKAMLPYCYQIKPKKIVYISCNPATLARDAGELVHHYGYRLQCVAMLNMFPHTSHIEALAVFTN